MIERAAREGVLLLRMAHQPANVFATPFCVALAEELERAAEEADTRAVILTGTGSAFSAGVDLFALVQGGTSYLEEFYESLERLFTGLRDFPKPLVAALNGHAIAGGFVLACGCDSRIMARGKGTLGAPELRVGVPFPGIALDLIEAALPRRHLREVALFGRIFGAEDALARGLVDELAEPEALEERAFQIAGDLASIPPEPYAVTKRQWAAARTRHAGSETDREAWELWRHPDTHARVATYLERTLGKSTRSG